MKCPKCGDPNAGYVVSRSRFWKKKSAKGTKQREDFRAKCRKCGFEFDAREYYNVVSKVTEKQPEQKGQIKMKYGENDK